MNLSKLLIVMFFFAVTTGGQEAPEANRASKLEQKHFSAEDIGVRSSVPIPEDVLSILRKDDEVRIVLKAEKLSAEQLPSSWFSISEIHLNHPRELDLVVKGEYPIVGANVTTFWIFCADPHGYRLLFTASSHDLMVKDTKWNGYREIETASATALQETVITYRFDGKLYTAFRKQIKNIH